MSNGTSINVPKISVITVCLNSAEFIEECITSVIRQDFSNYEYLVIDGGSDDGTVEVIKKYQSRISYWHSRNDRGLSDAFNIGFKNSIGNWILFVNSDDYLINPSILSQMSHSLDKWPKADVVTGQVMLMTRDNNPKIMGGPHGKSFSWAELRFKATIPHQAAFTNRKYFERIGLFDERYRTIMDYEHYLRGGPGIDIKFVPIVVSCMRDGGQSKINIKKSLRDLKQAQIETEALIPIVAEINRIYLFLRNLLGRTFIGESFRQFRNRRLRRIKTLQVGKSIRHTK